MAVHFHRVGHDNGVVIDAQDALGDAGLAVARAAVKEQGLVTDQRWTQLIQQAIGQYQVVEGLAQAFAAQTDTRRLRLHYFLVLLDGDRKSTRLNSSHLGISYAV